MTTPQLDPKIRRMLISAWDFHASAQFARTLASLRRSRRDLEEGGLTLVNAAHIALIVTYARPFSGNRSDPLTAGTVRLRKLLSLTPRQRELHNTIIDQRNRMVAHSDPDMWLLEIKTIEEREVPVVSDPRQPLSAEAADEIEQLALAVEKALSTHLASLGFTRRVFEQVVA